MSQFLTEFSICVFQFRVAGNNLLNVCKLVFKVSRNEKNDPAFLEGNILGKIMILKFFLWIYTVQKDFFSDIKHHIRLELVITYKNYKDRPEKIESNRNIIPHLRLQTKAQMSQCNLITTPAYTHTPP